MGTENKIPKKQIQEYLENASNALSTLKNELPLTKSAVIDAIGKHGNNSGIKSNIVGIQMLGTIIITPNLKIDEILNRLNCENLTFRIILRVLFYAPELGVIKIKISPDKLRIDSSNKVIHFGDYYDIEGCPSYFQFDKKEEFIRFKKTLKSFYSQLGLKQKEVFIN